MLRSVGESRCPGLASTPATGADDELRPTRWAQRARARRAVAEASLEQRRKRGAVLVARFRASAEEEARLSPTGACAQGQGWERGWGR